MYGEHLRRGFMNAVRRIVALEDSAMIKDNQLRELLAYCESSADLTSGATGAYADVANRLRTILNHG
jgi:hypothetical protein